MARLQKEIIDQDVDLLVSEIGTGSSAVIPLLQAIQKKYNYLPQAVLRKICELTEITPAEITGIATFYDQFRHTPVGESIIQVCTGTACFVKGAEQIVQSFFRVLNIPAGQDTDPEGKFTVQRISCLGCCTLAPVVKIGDITYGRVDANKVNQVIDDYLSARDQQQTPSFFHKGGRQGQGEIRIGAGSCCIASGSGKVGLAVEKSLAEAGIATTVKMVGCVGMCHRVPLVEVSTATEKEILYDQVRPEDVRRILLNHFKPGRITARFKNAAVNMLEKIGRPAADPGFNRHPAGVRDPEIQTFLHRQTRVVTEDCGQMDPLDLEDYQTRGGFTSLDKCLLDLSSEAIISQVKESGLRGRGGAGFPTGEKWARAYQAEGGEKYIICNGDEGDPGAFMDRMILESYPFRVIEGLIIAARAVGAGTGYFYIRAEYPLAVQRIKTALAKCREAGFCGTNILNSGFNFEIRIMEGAGAFVCGEETGLIASIEGKRGSPRYRPPYPAQSGLWGHPTLVQNCETLASLPWIFRHGVKKYRQMGTPNSPGTKVFSLAGKVKRGGLIEVPMGITIGEIVNEIGGGIENDRQFKAVQVGGPSGGCIPASMSHIRIDFDELTEAGAMMGSGGLLVMDDRDCMVDIARYFLTFICRESCGKCTCCRIGTRHMLNILEKICAGEGTARDLENLELIGRKVKQLSLCGLGKTAANPVLTTLAYFRDEYEAHLRGECPAKRCPKLIRYTITGQCIGCTICAQRCPVDAIPIRPYQKHEIQTEKCIRCGTCLAVCPSDAVVIK